MKIAGNKKKKNITGIGKQPTRKYGFKEEHIQGPCNQCVA